MFSKILPVQKIGNHTGARVARHLETRTEAIKLFSIAKKKLNDINHWQHINIFSDTEFRLTNEEGKIIEYQNPEIGNLIRIKLPFFNKSGNDYYWVRLDAFENSKDILKDEEIYGFRVSPVRSPIDNKKEEAHFYTSKASSTFLIIRNGRTVYAVEEGRNEVPNDKPNSFIQKFKNSVIAIGAILGFGHSEWKGLMQGILKDKE